MFHLKKLLKVIEDRERLYDSGGKLSEDTAIIEGEFDETPWRMRDLRFEVKFAKRSSIDSEYDGDEVFDFLGITEWFIEGVYFWIHFDAPYLILPNGKTIVTVDHEEHKAAEYQKLLDDGVKVKVKYRGKLDDFGDVMDAVHNHPKKITPVYQLPMEDNEIEFQYQDVWEVIERIS